MSLIFVKSITWEETFSTWAKDEASLPHWVEHYKERGFNSWEEWRKSSVKNLNPEQLNWNLYEIKNPLETISDFYGGPFRAWKKKYYGNNEMLQFKELAQNSELQNDMHINEIIQNFPKESTLIGLKKGEEVIVIEGMHRCCALAVAQEKGLNMDIKLFIILAEFSEDIPILGQVSSPT